MPLGLVSPLSTGGARSVNVLHRLFLEHPQSVGETYLEHQRQAFGFAGAMFLGALACLVHGLVPALFTRTGSGAVARLHERMVIHRTPRTLRPADARTITLGTDPRT